MHLINCLKCEKPFRQNREWQKFCSNDCRNIFHNEHSDKAAMLKAKRAAMRAAQKHAQEEQTIDQMADIMSERSSQ